MQRRWMRGNGVVLHHVSVVMGRCLYVYAWSSAAYATVDHATKCTLKSKQMECFICLCNSAAMAFE
jgi:hypothetical protein